MVNEQVITEQPQPNPETFQRKKEDGLSGEVLNELSGDVADGIITGVAYNTVINSTAANINSGSNCYGCVDCLGYCCTIHCDCCGNHHHHCCGVDCCCCDCGDCGDCGDCDCGSCDCGGCDCGDCDCGGCDCGDCDCGGCTIL